MSTADAFIARLPATAGEDPRRDIRTAFGIAENFKTKVASIRADRRFSDEGRRGEIINALRAGPLEHLGQLRAQPDAELARLRAERESFAARGPDKGDLFREMQRQEVRAALRQMPESARQKLALETTDPLMREAIMFAPAAMSGLGEDIKSAVTRAAVEATHGARLSAIANEEELHEQVATAMQVADDEMRRASGLDEAAYQEIRK